MTENENYKGKNLSDDLCRRIFDFEKRNAILQKEFSELQSRILKLQAQGIENDKPELLKVLAELSEVTEKLVKLNAEGEKIGKEIEESEDK